MCSIQIRGLNKVINNALVEWYSKIDADCVFILKDVWCLIEKLIFLCIVVSYVCVFVCVQWLSYVWLFVTPRTVACQAPLSTGFSRHEYWSGLLFSSSRDLLTQISNSHLLHLLYWQADSLPQNHLGSPHSCFTLNAVSCSKVVGCAQKCQEITEEVTRCVRAWYSGQHRLMHRQHCPASWSTVVCCLFSNLWFVLWTMSYDFSVYFWYYSIFSIP